MNVLEDRLHEYLNSFEPAVSAPSLCRVDNVDAHFAQAGLSPYLNAKGAIMQPQEPPENPVPMRVRICSHVTQAKFLHIEDSLGIGKLRLFAGTYRKGNGMDVHTHHFMDVDDARVVFHALAMAEPNFTYKEYKGTAQPGGQVTSRVLSVTSKGDQVYLELKTGPGAKTPTGAVTPNGKAEVEVNVAFKTYEARRLGQTVLAYIQAWDVLRLMAHRALFGKMAAYELVPTTSRNGMNNHQMQATQAQATANGATSRGVPAPHKSVNGKQSLADRQNAAASPSVAKPTQTNGSGVAQAVKGQTPTPVAAVKTPLPQVTRPVIREQLPVQTKTRMANAAATTATAKLTQVNQLGISPSRQEQTVIPDATAEQPGPSLAENSPEEPQPAVKGELEPANAAATPRIEETVQAVNGEQQPDRKMETATDAAAPIPTPQASQRLMANGQPPTRPLTRRGPAGRTMPEKRPFVMPPVVKQQVPVAAAIPVIPTAPVSRPNNSVQKTGQVHAKATAMAEAIYGADEQPLRYRNGVLVDRTNATEVEAFRQYQAEKQSEPLSRPQLRTYMRQKLTL